MNIQSTPITYGNFTEPFLEELAAYLKGWRVLEIFSGNGYLASRLLDMGIELTATSLFMSHDGHSHGMYTKVIECDAMKAVRRYGADAVILLLSWPTVTAAAEYAAMEWGAERPITFIGEYANEETGHLGGTATDRFFEITERQAEFNKYEARGDLEFAGILRSKPESVSYWRANGRI